MREIKFKAWYKREQQMCDVREISFVGQTVTISWADVGYDEDGVDFPIDERVLDFADCELLRYPGLRDRTGTKIYEGDICNVLENDGLWYLREVYYDTELAEFGYRYSFALLHAQFAHEREVVGNRYETPDLLQTEIAEV